MRHSLFCDDGGRPDHHGYTPSKAPPAYNPNQPNPYAPTKAPYTTKQKNTTKPVYTTKLSYTTKPKYTTKPGYTTKPSYTTKTPYNQVTRPPYTNFPGPAPDVGYCPWNSANYDPTSPSGAYKQYDCPNKQMCSLKYVARCSNNYFNKVYKNICKWQEALSLMPWLNKWLWALGVKYEQKNGVCNGNKGSYNDNYGSDRGKITIYASNRS